MTNVIKFPAAHRPAVAAEPAPEPAPVAASRAPTAAAAPARAVAAPTPKPVQGAAWASVIDVVWIVTSLFWPLLRWVLALDCMFQLLRAIYYSRTPDVYGWWTFGLHFAVLTAVTYFVMAYKPKTT